MRSIFAFVLLVVFGTGVVWADEMAKKDTVVVTGKYIMGENDSRNDAKQYALLDAKRKAMEQFGTYLSSHSTVQNYQLTQDEITTYTAGLMQTTILEEKLATEGEYMTMFVTIQAVIDPKEVEESLKSYRELSQEENDLPALYSQTGQLADNMGVSDETIKEEGKSEKPDWRKIEQTELLTRIVVESRKPHPDLKKMKRLISTWMEKYPNAKYILGYEGIALCKHQRKKEAVVALRAGLKNLSSLQKRLLQKGNKEMLRLVTAQKVRFRKYLDECGTLRHYRPYRRH